MVSHVREWKNIWQIVTCGYIRKHVSSLMNKHALVKRLENNVIRMCMLLLAIFGKYYKYEMNLEKRWSICQEERKGKEGSMNSRTCKVGRDCFSSAYTTS